jgi:arginase
MDTELYNQRRDLLFAKDSVGIIAAEFSGGQHRKGTEDGPKKLLELGLEQSLACLKYSTKLTVLTAPIAQTAATHTKVKNVPETSSVNLEISNLAYSLCAAGSIPLLLGGDHSLAMGSISGVARHYQNLSVIWVDAHADINTSMTTLSGNLHGCPVAFLAGIESSVPEFAWLKKCLDPRNIVYIGLRDVDPGERKILSDYNIKAYSMHEIDKWGIGKVMQMALDYLGNGPIHLSFDIDALDPQYAPSTGTPVVGGLSFREGIVTRNGVSKFY